MSDRKLASIQKITDISPIEGADKIVVAQVLGWQCVVKKDEFKVGDMVVYIEVDSICPERAEFEFLRERKFRVRTIKLRKQVSQGLVVPLSVLPNTTSIIEGADVSEALNVKKYDPQAIEEQALVKEFKTKSKVLKFFMGFAAFRWVYFKLNSVDKGWPSWGVGKTDEERIQVCAKILMEHWHEPWYVTEKIDGQSGTFFSHRFKKWGWPVWGFGVCSRNIWLKKKDNSNYWKMAEKFDLENKLIALKKDIVVQGEIAGPAIQKNKYGFTELDLFVFNVVEDGSRYTLGMMDAFCKSNGLKTVPVLQDSFVPAAAWPDAKEVKDVVTEMVKFSDAKSRYADIPREGVVWRLVSNPHISFKCINPSFLLKYNE